MVRAAGIEPAPQAWEAHVLPIYYARIQWEESSCKASHEWQVVFWAAGSCFVFAARVICVDR